MKTNLLIIFLSFGILSCNQEIIKFQVDAGEFDRLDCPIALNLSSLELDPESKQVQIIEFTKDSTILVSSQFDIENNLLWFVLDGSTAKQTKRNFALVKKNVENKSSQIDVQKNDGSLQFSFDNNPILSYQFEMVYPPEGIDSKYKKSGFIHPLWSPGGEILTRIQPPDHYHHYGIWGPWTKTHINGREVDFWNLIKGQGTVLFKKFKNKIQGDVYSGFTALQEHIDFGASEENRIAINEDLEIKIWNLGNPKKHWLVDYSTTIESPLDSGIIFDAYRYGGGIGFRATENWHKDNTSVLTSENKNRLTADGSNAKWAIVEGETTNAKSGILFMGLPSNRKFPEPMRVWPIDANGGRGDIFFEFCPIRHESWKIENKKKYQLKYRMLIFDGKLNPEMAEIYWRGFANPPEIIIESK